MTRYDFQCGSARALPALGFRPSLALGSDATSAAMTGAVFALHRIRPVLASQQGSVSKKEIMKVDCLRNRNTTRGFNLDCGKNSQNENSVNSVCHALQFELSMDEVLIEPARHAVCDSLDQSECREKSKGHKSP